MPPKKKMGNEFVWSNDEAELLLNVGNEYKVSKAAETMVFSVHTYFLCRPYQTKYVVSIYTAFSSHLVHRISKSFHFG